MPLVEMLVGVQDTCHMSCASWWHSKYSKVELKYSTVIEEGIPPSLHAYTTGDTKSRDGRKAMWVPHGKADDTTACGVDTRAINCLRYLRMHDMHAPIQQDLIWKHGTVNDPPNRCQQ